LRIENWELGEAGLVVLLYLLAVGAVGEEMGVAVAGGEDKEKGQNG
jgi:hypothetical protein